MHGEAKSYPHMKLGKLSTHELCELPRVYPKAVENSVKGILEDLGSENAAAFTNRWDLADIVAMIPAVAKISRANPNIRNPAGLLWRMLEARERKQKQELNSGLNQQRGMNENQEPTNRQYQNPGDSGHRPV